MNLYQDTTFEILEVPVQAFAIPESAIKSASSTSPAPAAYWTPLRPEKRPRLSIEDHAAISDQQRLKRSKPTEPQISANTKATTRRGRPSKPVEPLIDPQELANLIPEYYRYRERRNKNNEASRRCRKNRKDRENALEREMHDLERLCSELEAEEQKLISECSKWRNAIKQLELL